MVSGHTAGSPENEQERWTCLNHEEIVALMRESGGDVSRRTVRGLLKKHNYVKRKSQKMVAGGDVANRNEQFENIAVKTAQFELEGNPFISMDTKKKEVLGNYSRSNDHLYGTMAEPTNDHDFKKKGTLTAVPHGIYDQRHKHGQIVVGNSHDTSEFSCNCIKHWWLDIGRASYPLATRLLILCDGGGSNSSRHHIFKQDLQSLATALDIDITIAHYPPYCSKWNPIEHRFFPHVSNALRGARLESIDHVVQQMARTKTKTGISISVAKDENEYLTGRKYQKGFKESNNIVFDDFLPRWNYTAKASTPY